MIFHISPSKNKDSIEKLGILSPLEARKHKFYPGIGSDSSRLDVVQLFCATGGDVSRIFTSFISNRKNYLGIHSASDDECDMLAFVIDKSIRDDPCFIESDEVAKYCKRANSECSRYWGGFEVWFTKAVEPSLILEHYPATDLPAIERERYINFWNRT